MSAKFPQGGREAGSFLAYSLIHNCTEQTFWIFFEKRNVIIMIMGYFTLSFKKCSTPYFDADLETFGGDDVKTDPLMAD